MKSLCWATETVSADSQMGDLDQLPHTFKAQGTRQKRRWKEFELEDREECCEMLSSGYNVCCTDDLNAAVVTCIRSSQSKIQHGQAQL